MGKDDERRRFFRITDTLGVAYHVLTADEVANKTDSYQAAVKTYQQITHYSKKIEQLVGEMRIKDSLSATVLDLLNKKIDCVLTQLQLDNIMVQRIAHSVQAVNISACGIAFRVNEKIDIGAIISLDLLLKPTNIHVGCRGEVVTCVPSEAKGKYYIRVEYTEMDAEDQELLIQHVVKRQASKIRFDRNNKDV